MPFHITPTAAPVPARRTALRLTARLLPAIFLLVAAAGATAEEGFRPLFNGKNLDGWKVIADKGDGAGEWRADDGLLKARPGHSWLASDKEYGDFILQVEWRVPENGNSGIFLRVPRAQPGERPWETGMEIQVLDDKGPQYEGKLKPFQYSGSIYGVVAADASAFRGAGQWNACEIKCQGDLVQVSLNGKLVAQGDMSRLEPLKNRPRKGYLGLQNHGTAAAFRNVRIKPLE